MSITKPFPNYETKLIGEYLNDNIYSFKIPTVTSVEGKEYEIRHTSSYGIKLTIATDKVTGITEVIASKGNVNNDLQIRKRIAQAFGHDSFKK